MAFKKIDKFQLPRSDWYDVIDENPLGQIRGRMYKDALIENFNAIEKQLKDLIDLDAFIINLPDFTQISFPDVDLSSEDNRVVNLKSFLSIMACTHYPIELEFQGVNKCTKVSFWNDEYQLIRLTDKTINTTSTNKHIYLDYVNNNIYSSSNATTPDGCIFVGEFVDNRIIAIGGLKYSNINVLPYLANMSEETVSKTFTSRTREEDYNIYLNGRSVGSGDTNTKTKGSNAVVFRDVGRK